MIKDLFLFYEIHHDSVNLFKIKNADLRNKNLSVDYRAYIGDIFWQEFILYFKKQYREALENSNIVLEDDYKGFILIYTDTVKNKEFVSLSPEKIIELLS